MGLGNLTFWLKKGTNSQFPAAGWVFLVMQMHNTKVLNLIGLLI